MVQLTPVDPPIELTPIEVAALTTLYKLEGKSVWNQDYIKEALLSMSHDKCGYCECKLDEESKYLEVEHFKPKCDFPDLVVDWDNLLPSCKRCNGQKGEHNTDIDPIVNPCKNDPKNHLKLKAYRFYPRNGDSIGRMTIEVLDLNDRERLVNIRADIGNAIHEVLEKLFESAEEYLALAPGNKRTRRQRKMTNGISSLLEECQPTTEYSATAATELLEDETYHQIKEILIESDLWSDHMDELENVAKAISLT